MSGAPVRPPWELSWTTPRRADAAPLASFLSCRSAGRTDAHLHAKRLMATVAGVAQFDQGRLAARVIARGCVASQLGRRGPQLDGAPIPDVLALGTRRAEQQQVAR